MTNRIHRPLLALGLLAALAGTPSGSEAFYQKTTIEGSIGTDVSGVWLSVQHVMPMFRVRLDRDADNIAPFKVGPIDAKTAKALGNPAGVAIAEFTDERAGSKYGIFKGDIISKVNTVEVENEEDFKKALQDVKEWFMITVRRPALSFTTARIVKIRYDADEVEVDGVSQIGGENVGVYVVDVELPFQSKLESSRQSNDFFEPSKEEIETLKEGWYKLPSPTKPLYVNGEHRVVAAAQYDPSLKEDENLEGTEFALISTLAANPLTAGGGTTIGVYGFKEISANRMSGTFVESTLATAPFPISIEFGGGFEMTKLAPYSNKDLEHRRELDQEKAMEAQAEENREIELAPDVPANLPPELDNVPEVAE